MRAFAAELKARRTSFGISQEELAHRCGVNRTFLAKLEIAANQPSLTVLLKISEGLNADLLDVLAGTLTRYAKEVRTTEARAGE